jgi:DNA-directed RNA polymerase subunit beta
MIKRKSYSSNEFRLELPDLLEMQKVSYERFLQAGVPAKDRRNEGLERVFRDAFPTSDAKGLLVLRYSHYTLSMPRYSVRECRERGVTYSRPLIVHLELQTFKEDGEEKKLQDQVANDVFFCDLPIMTENGTFIINGAERVVISQLHRSPGVSFDSEQLPSGKMIYQSRIIPNRGSWLEFNTENDILYMLIDRKKKLPATVLLRAVGYETNEQILAIFHTGEKLELNASEECFSALANRVLFKDAISPDGEVIASANSILNIETCQKLLDASVSEIEVIKENLEEDNLIHNTLASDASKDGESAMERIYQTTKQQQDRVDAAVAKVHFNGLFFDHRRYEIGEIGRYRLNSKVYVSAEQQACVPSGDIMTLTTDDFISVIRYMIGLYNAEEGYSLDDIDHLGNRRIRSVGELVANQISIGISRMLRSVRESFSSREREGVLTPAELINSRTVNSMVAAFFGSSQLSQFMDQINPLSELTNKRRISALGPGGLSRDRAGLEVRDVHHSHYGRLCPIETPEGANIGLINSLATFSIVNRFGFIETPYRIVGLLPFQNNVGKTYEFPEAKWHTNIMKSFFGSANQQLLTQTELSENEIKTARKKFSGKQLELFDMFCNKSFEFNFGNESTIIKNGVTIGVYKKGDSKPKADWNQQALILQMVVSDWIVYLTAYEEDHYRIAPASTILDPQTKRFINDFVLVRAEGDFPSLPNIKEISVEDVETQRIDLMDVSPMQIVSVAAGLIPFLEHDDANRALMGSNMQRQAVPLLRSEAPIVGTGLEKKVALDSGTLVRARNNGVVTYVDAVRIEVLRDRENENYETIGLPSHDIYDLRKFERSNQDSCINQKPVCKVGDKIKAGEVLADGASTDNGELALGKNIRVAFLPWKGYNYEDAIIISEELAIKDTFTSIHIEEYEIEVRETKRGKEEITRDVPNVSEKDRSQLGEDGIVRIGVEVRPGDILVGKVTPKGESELTPEEKLLRAIFGSKSGDVSDSSLRVPSGVKGIVVDTHVFQRREQAKLKEEELRLREELANKIRTIANDFTERVKMIEEARQPELARLLLDKTSGDVRNGITNEIVVATGKKWTKELLDKTDFSLFASGSVFCDDALVQEEVNSLLNITNRRILELNDLKEKEIDKVNKGDELKPGVFKVVKVYIAKKRRLTIGDKMAGRHGNKGVVSKVVSIEDMPFTEDGRPVQILLNPLGVPSRMNVGQVLEVHLGWAAIVLGLHVETPVFNGVSFSKIENELKKAYIQNPVVKVSENSWTETEKKEFREKHGKDVPKNSITGKATLYDGCTGEPFLNDVTIGTMYMLKLNHLVEDKIHARSTGPYALVTQQPLGGKSHSGGQRFGEMEVWALEAYGAAYTLQELLTVKSDDVIGRNKIYDAIVKGENPPASGTPESFRVLVREFRSLGLDIKVSEAENA